MSRRFSLPGLLLMSLAACGRKADLVITGGVVWTGLSSGEPQPGAVAVRGGRILAGGDTAAGGPHVGGGEQGASPRGGPLMPRVPGGPTPLLTRRLPLPPPCPPASAHAPRW